MEELHRWVVKKREGHLAKPIGPRSSLRLDLVCAFWWKIWVVQKRCAAAGFKRPIQHSLFKLASFWLTVGLQKKLESAKTRKQKGVFYFSLNPFLLELVFQGLVNRKNQKPAHGGRGRFAGDPVLKAWTCALGWGGRVGT